MEILELKLRVPGRPILNQSTKALLIEGEALSPLPHSLQARLPGPFVERNGLTAQVQNSAVFITEDWVVSIHGKDLMQCISAMSVLLNSISRELGESVEVDLLTQQNNKTDEPLHIELARQVRKDRIKAGLKWGITILASALAGALIQWLLMGGFLQ